MNQYWVCQPMLHRRHIRTITTLISGADHRVITSIYKYLFLLPILYSLDLQQASQQVLLLFSGVTCTFILEDSDPFVILPVLGCHNFSLTLITGHGNTKRCPEGSPALQVYSFFPLLWNKSPISPVSQNHSPLLRVWLLLRVMRSPTWLRGHS